MLVTAARVHTGHEVLTPGYVRIDGLAITAVGPYDTTVGTPDLDLGDVLIAPGYVDVHGHGGGGASYAGDPETAIALHRRHGTTTIVASLVTQDLATLREQVERLTPYVTDRALAGIHLEGPWMSEKYHGAHPVPLLRDPDPSEVCGFVDASGGTIRQITLAVERPGGLATVRELSARGVVSAVGHTDADHATTVAAIEAGATGATHLFNAMRPIHHRAPGPIVALMADERVWLEVVADGVHVNPALVRYLFETHPDRMVLVTDSMAAAGSADGDYILGELSVEVRDGVARIAGTDTIAGSTLTLAAAVRNAVAYGVDPFVAVRAATLFPARYMVLAGVGELVPGAVSDLVVLDSAYEVRGVMRHGTWVVDPGH
jgi:N-acetylglucosamine-6-phosphate deacetylase